MRREREQRGRWPRYKEKQHGRYRRTGPGGRRSNGRTGRAGYRLPVEQARRELPPAHRAALEKYGKRAREMGYGFSFDQAERGNSRDWPA